MITLYEIAKRCGVSPSTVSKVMNNYDSIPQETKDKVLKAIKDLNYVPNAGARALSKGKSFNVGVLAYFGTDISPFKHGLFTEILDSFQAEMNRHNYDLLFVSRNVRGKNETFIKNCIARRVDGVLLFGDTNYIELKEILDSTIPSIAFDYGGEKGNSVTSNNKELTQGLIEHLIGLGHKKIAFIGGDIESYVNKIRLETYEETLNKHSIQVDKNLIVTSRYYVTYEIDKIVKKLMGLNDKPTAIMFPDDYTAISGIKSLKEIGYNCPKDISITGFDGIDISQAVTPSLTTAKQDVVTIGETLAKELLRVIHGDHTIKKVIVQGSILFGESSGKVKQ